MKSPILPVACCFALGILAARASPSGCWWLLAACGTCGLAGFAAWRSNWDRVAVALVFAGFVLAGAADAQLFANRFPVSDITHLERWGLNFRAPLRLTGTILTPPLQTPYGLQFDLDVAQVSSDAGTREATGKVRLRVAMAQLAEGRQTPVQLVEGDLIRVRARLHRPPRYKNPGEFDYRAWLQSIQDIAWQGSVERRDSFKLLRCARPVWFHGLLGRIRMRLLASIDQLYPPWSVEGRDGAVLKAVLLGDRSALDSETVENFRKSGLYHLLVVAGLHVGLLMLLAELLLRGLGLREFSRSVLLLFFLALYAGLVEERAPTLRASLMIASYLVARLLDRRQAALNAVGIAGLILLMRRPAWLFDSGFQLSFAAALLIAGLAVPWLDRSIELYRRGLARLGDMNWDTNCAPRVAQFRIDLRSLASWLSRRRPFLQTHEEGTLRAVTLPIQAGLWVVELVIFSAILQLGLLLPMADIFHRVTLAGIGLNALAVPLMTILLGVAVPTVLLNMVWPPLAVLLAKALAVMMTALLTLTRLPRLSTWLSFRVPTPSDWVAWGFALSLVAAGFALARAPRLLKVAAVSGAAFGALIALHPFAARIPTGGFEVTSLDCGGGEGLFIVLPDRRTILVGACGGRRAGEADRDPLRTARWDAGENIVSPYLWSRGISGLDALMIPDTGGASLQAAASVLRNFHVHQLWVAAAAAPQAAPLLSFAHERGARVRWLAPGNLTTLSRSVIHVFGPGASGQSSGNYPGALVRIANSSGSLLLARDASRAAIGALFSSKSQIASTVLQAPRSAAAYKRLCTRISVIRPRMILGFDSGAGAKHDPDGLRKCEKSGAQVFFSNREGAVTIEMKADKTWASVYSRRAAWW